MRLMQLIAPSTGTSASPTVEIFAAACTGSGRLSGQIGRPVVLIEIAFDAAAAIADLNKRRFGCGTLWPQSFQPLDYQDGWDDWRPFALEFPYETRLPLVPDVEIGNGQIKLPLPRLTAISELREQMAASLRHLRMQDVVRRPEWLEERSDLLADILVHPRYELPRYPDFRAARLVETLYVLDPAEDAWRLLYLTLAAFQTASDEVVMRL